jgi:hypothetical protein
MLFNQQESRNVSDSSAVGKVRLPITTSTTEGPCGLCMRSRMPVMNGCALCRLVPDLEGVEDYPCGG